MPAAAPPIDIRIVAPAALAAHISAGVATFDAGVHAVLPQHRAVGADDRERGVDDVVAVRGDPASVIGIQPRPGCTPLVAPSQFSQ